MWIRTDRCISSNIFWIIRTRNIPPLSRTSLLTWKPTASTQQEKPLLRILCSFRTAALMWSVIKAVRISISSVPVNCKLRSLRPLWMRYRRLNLSRPPKESSLSENYQSLQAPMKRSSFSAVCMWTAKQRQRTKPYITRWISFMQPSIMKSL